MPQLASAQCSGCKWRCSHSWEVENQRKGVFLFYCIFNEAGKNGQMDPYFSLSWCIFHINNWSSFEFLLVFVWFRQRLLRLCLPQLRYELLDFCNIVSTIRLHTIHCSNLILQGCCFWHSVENIIFPLYSPSLNIFFHHLNDFLVFSFGETFHFLKFHLTRKSIPKTFLAACMFKEFSVQKQEPNC